MFVENKEYKTRGGWTATLKSIESLSDTSYYIFKHKKDFSNKGESWIKWFIRDATLSVWHKKDGSCREHNWPLCGRK